MMHMDHAVPQRRCNRAALSRPVVHLRRSGLVLERAISAELSHILGPEHHNRGAGAICKQRGTRHDAYGSRSAHRRCNRTALSRPVVHLRRSGLVLERAISAELSRILGRTLVYSIHFCAATCFLLLFCVLALSPDIAIILGYYYRMLLYTVIAAKHFTQRGVREVLSWLPVHSY